MNYHRIKKKVSLVEKLNSLSITVWIIIITAIISIVTFYLWNSNPGLVNCTALYAPNILSGQCLWSLVSHIFIHGNFAHLAINMFVLFSLGSLLERIIGRKRYIWFYLISGIFAGILSVLLSGAFGRSGSGGVIFGSPLIPMVGASGAIFAIAGLLMTLIPKLRFTIIFFPFFSLPAYIMIPAVLFITWIGTVISAFAFGKAVLLGNVAHFGGFLAGLCYGFYLRIKYKKKINMLQRYFR